MERRITETFPCFISALHSDCRITTHNSASRIACYWACCCMEMVVDCLIWYCTLSFTVLIGNYGPSPAEASCTTAPLKVSNITFLAINFVVDKKRQAVESTTRNSTKQLLLSSRREQIKLSLLSSELLLICSGHIVSVFYSNF